MSKTLIFDIETDGFLEELTTVHSLCTQDAETGVVESYSDSDDFDGPCIENGLYDLMHADLIVGHNVIKFDVPAIKKVYPGFFIDEHKVFDTHTASRLIWTNLFDTDMTNIRKGTSALKTKDAGSHSLDAWGKRLGEWKGDYQEMMEAQGLDPWKSWNQDMQDYCEQDIVVTQKLYGLILKKDVAPTAMRLEHELQWIMAQVERNGYRFDEAKAMKLLAELIGTREEMAQSLRDLFPPWKKKAELFIPKRDNRTLGYKKGVPVQKYKDMVFNPSSREQIADRLMVIRGWSPTEFTPKGKPKVDEDVLKDLPYPEAKRLTEYMQLQKIIAYLGEGDNAWLKMVRKGRIHGNYNINGAVTGRATHFKPNIGQVPGNDKKWGPECRELFGGPTQIGIDVSGLELRMLGHFMARHDNGAYAKEVIEGDIHTANQEAAGLPSRSQAKTFIYAFLYGAGNGKIGSIVGGSSRQGGVLRKKFLEGLPALKKLQEGVQNKAKQSGSLTGLDGRKLHIRSPHSALNTLLQSAGALICKQWIIEFVKLLKEEGLYQTKVKIVAWVHDEIQLEIDEDLVVGTREVRNDKTKELETVPASPLGDLAIKAIERAGDHFKIRVPLTGEYKIGSSWKDCH